MKNKVKVIFSVLIMLSAQQQTAAKNLKNISLEHNSTEANYKNKKSKINDKNNKNFNNGKLSCESKNNRRAHCSISTRNGIRLTKELSRRKCLGNWGYDYYGVWVVNGCRARFTTDRYQNHWGAQFNKDDIIRCESYRSGKISCPIKHKNKNFIIKLIHQLSARTCRDNWGHNKRDIWVKNGCKADFKVKMESDSNNRSAEDYRNNQAKKELICLSKKYRKHYCDMSGLRDVKLIEVLSKSEKTCFNNWGYDIRGIWVNNNCKARFTFSRSHGQSNNWRENSHNNDPNNARNNDTNHKRPGDSRTLKCKSRSDGKKVCANNVRKANLKRAISKGKYPCKGNWGIDKHGNLFVKNNCYAEFNVWD